MNGLLDPSNSSSPVRAEGLAIIFLAKSMEADMRLLPDSKDRTRSIDFIPCASGGLGV